MTISTHRALSDASTADLQIALARSGTAAQRAAIGVGLAQAAVACVVIRPEVAEAIRLKATEANTGEWLTTFWTASNAVGKAVFASFAGSVGSAGSGPAGGNPEGGGNDSRGNAFPDSRGGFSVAGGEGDRFIGGSRDAVQEFVSVISPLR